MSNVVAKDFATFGWPKHSSMIRPAQITCIRRLAGSYPGETPSMLKLGILFVQEPWDNQICVLILEKVQS